MDKNVLLIFVKKVLYYYVDIQLAFALVLRRRNVPTSHNFLEVNINAHQQPSLCCDNNNVLFLLQHGTKDAFCGSLSSLCQSNLFPSL